MAKYTLLEMVQSILSSMDSDEVNAIDDTVESVQVVGHIKDTYYELMSQKDWNHLRKPMQLTGLGDTDYPTTFSIPASVVDLDDVRYEVREDAGDDLDYKKIIWKDPIDFTDYILKRKSTDSNVETKTVYGTSTPLLIVNDEEPSFWTSYDEQYIVMDSYNSDVDSTLQTSKSLIYCVTIPTFDDTDGDYVPECPENMFPTLLAESKKACFAYIKQSITPIDEKRSLRGMNRIKNKDHVAHDRSKYPNFGRS